MTVNPTPMLGDTMRPDAEGRFGAYGGKYVPETLMPALAELDAAYKEVIKDPAFQVRLP
jgi:tryptophan synthase beta chain